MLRNPPDILIGRVKITAVPGIRIVSRTIGKIEKTVYLPFWISAEYPFHIDNIAFLHSQQIIIFSVITLFN